ncbi:hybrid sensor histidine kinase/response regulator [Phragmitibacter flavus]|uniref:hybrid sensor histidine kinase/response regulator n=1 Tax=Phragmitibacter flavus TaxID=2576071 RepID=UPI001F0DC94F|nr:hybrid sensor histidine kinase/response regulator [Phragmitibacter flavus]
MIIPSVSDGRDTILIVDDQEQNLKVVGTVLTMTGYEVIPASSGVQALKRLEAHVPDLILLDVLMPEMDGLEVCRQIKGMPELAEIPIIFLSAADDKNLIVQALETGGVDYVTKPFNKAELLTRVRAHLALKHARDQLRHLAEDKDELLGIMAHDLKNHLAGMRMSAGLLQSREAELPEKCVKMVGNIIQSTDSMIAFVREFLANQSAERLQLRSEAVDLGLIIKGSAARHEAMAAAKNIALVLDLSSEPVVAQADAEAVTRVLDNLVSNALKFTPSGGTLTLATANGPGRWVQFSVIDDGPGFTASDEEKMFRRYARLSARPTGGEPSTGLGLSIVKRLLEGMKGIISLNKSVERGSCFVIKLPVVGS